MLKLDQIYKTTPPVLVTPSGAHDDVVDAMTKLAMKELMKAEDDHMFKVMSGSLNVNGNLANKNGDVFGSFNPNPGITPLILCSCCNQSSVNPSCPLCGFL